MNSSPSVSLIAGNGEFPEMFIRSAKAHGYRVAVVALKGEATSKAVALADKVCWVEVVKFQKIMDCLHDFAAREVAMAGGVKKSRFFIPQKPDMRTLKLAQKILVKKDDSILRTVASEIESEGFQVIASTAFLEDALAPAGCLTQRVPSADEMQDIQCGYLLAKQVGVADVGQTVVVKNGIPLAIEAIEGTDACILRGGQLAKRAVVVKVVKPHQDLRFDLPVIGPNTIKTLKRAKIFTLGLEADKVLLIMKSKILDLANRYRMSIYGVDAKND